MEHTQSLSPTEDMRAPTVPALKLPADEPCTCTTSESVSLDFTPQGVCPKQITVKLKGSQIESVSFEGGCKGNLAAIGKLVENQDAKTIIHMLRGNTCGKRPTSCTDQMTYALEQALLLQNA